MNPRKLLLIDGLGAIVSAIFLGIVLVMLQEIVGMPTQILYTLSGLASLFAIYSLSCYFFVKDNWNPYLRFIAIVNMLYCILSLVLVYIYFSELTVLGLTYFILEKVIVLTLVWIELRASS